MENIEIAGKYYPFIISASSAKQYFTALKNDNADDSESIDLAVNLVYEGIRDANMRRGFIRRTFSFFLLPSKKLVMHTLDISQIRETMTGLFPKTELGKGKKK